MAIIVPYNGTKFFPLTEWFEAEVQADHQTRHNVGGLQVYHR